MTNHLIPLKAYPPIWPPYNVSQPFWNHLHRHARPVCCCVCVCAPLCKLLGDRKHQSLSRWPNVDIDGSRANPGRGRCRVKGQSQLIILASGAIEKGLGATNRRHLRTANCVCVCVCTLTQTFEKRASKRQAQRARARERVGGEGREARLEYTNWSQGCMSGSHRLPRFWWSKYRRCKTSGHWTGR